MGKPKINILGQIINGITVLSKVSVIGSSLWICKCHCGKEFTPSGSNLLKGATKSCGCLHRKIVTIHGDTKTSFYQSWRDLRDRCSNPNNKFYKNYGGRGITFCERWNSYLLFKEDMFDTYYESHLTLERIDVNGNYEPSNCTWIPKNKQARNTTRNTTRNRYIETPEGKITLIELSEKTGIKYPTLSFRLRFNKNISYEKLTSPVGKYVRKTIKNDEELT